MAKPAAYFPGSALPNLQELATDLDFDNLGIAGSITQKADVTLTATYASSGAINITVTGAFATWPAFGVVENLTTLEQIAWTRTNSDTLVVSAAGRARNGTTPAGGSSGHNIRFIERRGLGRFYAQMLAELVAHDDILRGSIAVNEAVNGNMFFATLGSSAASTGTPAITAAQAYRLDSMFCRPAGAAVTVQQSTTVPNTDSEFSAQINGAASVTTVNFGQRFEAARAKRLRKKLTFSAYVQNISGAAFTPKIQLYTPTNPDNYGAVNAIALDVNLQQCADNAWTKVSYTFDPSGYTGIANGFELSIQIPSGSCVAGDTIRVTQFQLERGSNATPFSDAGALEEMRCQRFCFAFDTDKGELNYGPSLKYGTRFIEPYFKTPVTMIKSPVFSATSGLTWNAGAPGAGQVAAYDYIAGGYATILGALSLSGGGSRNLVYATIIAATSFSPTDGRLVLPILGTGIKLIWSANL